MKKIAPSFSWRICTLITSVVISTNAYSQYSGTHYVGAGEEFTTIQGAVTSLASSGVNGAVTMLVKTGNYNEQVNIPPIPGASAVNTITFKSETQTPDDVMIYSGASSSSGSNYVIYFNDCDYVSFEYFEIVNTSTSSYSAVINFNGTAEYNGVRHNKLIGKGGAPTDVNESIIFLNRQHAPNTEISYNDIQGGSWAIRFYIYSFPSEESEGVKINYNTINSYRGIHLYGQNKVEITGNTVSTNSYDCIYLSRCSANITVYGNKINSYYTGEHAGIYLNDCDATIAFRGSISNNAVYVYDDGANNDTNYGIYLLECSYQDIYHNTVYLKNTNSAGFGIRIWNGSSIGAKNNMIAVENNGFAFGSNITLTECNYNNYYTKGNHIVSWISTNYCSLSSFQTATGTNANSTDINPCYVSTSNADGLIPQTHWLENTGANLLSVVPKDIDGVDRTATPDIGAYEFTPSNTTTYSGNLTIKESGGTFASFTEAVDSLKKLGISGSVNIIADTKVYTEHISIPAIPGASAINTITITSSTADSTDVTLQYSSTSNSDNYVIELAGADYISINKITLKNTGSNYAQVLKFTGHASNNSAENCVFEGSGSANSSGDRAIIVSYLQKPQNLLINNNILKNGAMGILLFGPNNSDRADLATISNNEISGGYHSIYVGFYTNFEISNNNCSNFTYSGIALSEDYSPYVIKDNRLSSTVSTERGLSFYYCSGTGDGGLVYNNFIYLENSSTNYGIIVHNCTYVSFYNNSINLISSSANSRAVYNYYYNTGSNLIFKNNNFTVIGPGHPFYSNNSVGILESDYNNFYTTGSNIAYWNSTNYTTLASFSAATGKDTHSVNFDPVYTSKTDLHTNSYWIDNKGIPLPSFVTDDIDGEPRDATNPDIGADEFTSALTPYSGEYTIGPTGRFATFTIAVDSLKMRGALGSITFKVQTGNYNEQISIPQIAGVTGDVFVIFETETGNAEDVILAYDPGQSNNYLVKLAGADNITFRNLSFQSGNNQYARIFALEGNCENISITDNILQGRSEYSSSDFDAIIYTYDNNPIINSLTVSGNSFFNGSYGIFLFNNSTTYGENLNINNNVFNTYYTGTNCKYFNGPKIENNTFNFNGAENIGINVQYCASASTSGMIIRRNRVYNDSNISSSSGGGIYIYQCNANSSFHGLIANNEIRVGMLNSGRTIGLTVVSSSYLDFYHNSINISSNQKDDIAFYSNGGSNLNICNNNFVILGDLAERNSSFGLVYYITSSTINVCNYNNYYTAGNNLAYWNGTYYGTLANLRAATGKDANSINYFPAFRNGDILTTNSPWLDNRGTPIATVSTDINGTARNGTTPDIGAYEYTTTLTPIPAGTYTIGFGGYYPTIDSLVNSLMEQGIAGAAVFEFLPGNHSNANISLKDIPGASATDSIVIQSQSGNPSNTVVTSIQESYRNHIVKLNGTDFITFKNLTFNSGGTAYSSIFRMEGNAQHINIINNIVNGASYSGDENNNKASVFIPNDQVVDNLLVQDNTFTNNSTGIYFGGNSSFSFSSLKIVGNTFNNQYRQIYFRYTNKPYIYSNELNNGSKYGVYLEHCTGDSKILNNKVFSTINNFYGIYLYYSDGTTGNKGLIANNFVKTASATSSDSYSIKLDYSNYQRIYYNSSMITGSGGGTAFDVYSGGNLQVVNNIFANQGTDTYTYKINSNSAVTVSDYNDFYSTSTRNVRFNSVDYATLEAYKAVSLMDYNSVAVNPLFTSSSNFFLQNSSPVIGLAIPLLTDVTKDYNEEVRDVTDPDIGADEFSCVFFSDPVTEDVTSCSNEEVPSLYAEGVNIKWYSDPELTNEIWTANEFNPDVSAAAVYNYYVTQSEGECTSKADTVTLTIFAAPELSAVLTHIDCQGTSYGTINLSVGGSEGPFNYLWTNDEVTQDITNLAVGDYSVQVTDVHGCTEIDTFTITSPSEIILEIITQDTECSTNMGSATVVASGGEAPYTQYWSNGETGTVIDSLYSDIYYVTVTDDLGCSKMGVATINDIGGPEITVESITDVSCYGGSNGAISLSVSGGATPYEYLWSNGATTKDINNIKAGQYEIEVSDTDGCKAIESIIVEEPNPINISLNISQTSCGMSNGSVQASVLGGTSPYDYSWSSGGGNTTQVSNLSIGAYSVTVTDAESCTATKYFSVSEIGAPSVIIDSVFLGTCGDSNGAIYISVYGSYESYNFLWSNGDETEDLIGVDPETYSVTVSDEGGCDAVQVATIQANKPDPNPICLVSVDSETNYNEIVWEKEYTVGVHHYNVYKEGSQAGIYTLIGSVNVDEEAIFIDSLSNVLQRSWSYKISVVDSCDAESDLSDYHKTMHLTMNLGLNNTVNLIWNHYEGFNYDTYYIYRLSNSGWELLDSVPSTSTSYTDFDPILDETLFYVIEIQHPYGCNPFKQNRSVSRSNVTKSAQVASTPPPIVGNISVCTNVEIPNLYAEGTDVTWYSDEGLTTLLWSGNEYNHGISESGVYTFYVIQTINNLPSPAVVVTLTIWAAPELSALITNIDCQDNEYGSIDLSVSESLGPFNYLWSNNEITQDISNLSAGDYSVQVTDINGCQEADTFTITNPSEIILTITTDDSECNESSGSASVSASGGTSPYTYLWTNGDYENEIDSLQSGVYYVTVTDDSGCSAVGTASVNDTGGPDISVDSVVDVLCNGGSNGSVNLTVSGGAEPYGFTWSNGAVIEDIEGIPAGQYEVQVSDAEGCRTIESITVQEPDAITISLDISQASCGLSDGTALANVSGGTSPYTYLWSNSVTDSIATDLPSGNYSITVTDYNSCTVTKNFSISEVGAPSVIIDSVLNSTCGHSDGAIYISVYGSGEPYSYSWSNGNTTQDLVGVEPNTYFVTVNNADGCDAVQIATINTISPDPNPLCLVTVDSTTNQIQLIWEKQYTASVHHYNIYRESGETYSPIGSVLAGDAEVFIDTISNPSTRPWRYKLSVADSCGVESNLSESHQTMHLSLDVSSTNSINLSWNHYQGFEFDTYYILRRSNSGWAQIGSVASTSNSYVDNDPIFDEYLYYLIEIQHPQGCNLNKEEVTKSHSNISSGVQVTDTSSIVTFDQHIKGIYIYPNPNDGSFVVQIESSKVEEFWYNLYNTQGQLIESKSIGLITGKAEKSITLNSLPDGTYLFKIYCKSGAMVKKIIINR